jgi:hypothetical protein
MAPHIASDEKRDFMILSLEFMLYMTILVVLGYEGYYMYTRMNVESLIHSWIYLLVAGVMFSTQRQWGKLAAGFILVCGIRLYTLQ